eukprot:CAMPEP_0119407136 /NCGR_PEP_ID=MMETSP1335-20130426/1162_1 /TAXON_ID=259385 /ORGANISM="Chrysoculter rhomboideus, Strain RCC1486" /LENGTH=319 /DNA_ID=CAMNT_0007431229 /DNA_START=342 /DNA_END=1298 /DNA_ORIENTATION=-
MTDETALRSLHFQLRIDKQWQKEDQMEESEDKAEDEAPRTRVTMAVALMTSTPSSTARRAARRAARGARTAAAVGAAALAAPGVWAVMAAEAAARVVRQRLARAAVFGMIRGSRVSLPKLVSGGTVSVGAALVEKLGSWWPTVGDLIDATAAQLRTGDETILSSAQGAPSRMPALERVQGFVSALAEFIRNPPAVDGAAGPRAKRARTAGGSARRRRGDMSPSDNDELDDDDEEDDDDDSDDGELTDDEDMEEYYAVDEIVRKEERKGVVGYIVRWEGVDTSGRPWPESWQPRANLTEDLVLEFERHLAREEGGDGGSH